MILSQEIKEKAREYGVPTSTIERDYAQNWLLKYLSNSNMILKGGTGIRKVYIKNYRFSDDLDFTLIKNINKDDLLEHIYEATEKAKEETGINFEITNDLLEVNNGLRGNIYFSIIKKTSKTPLGIVIDITNFDKEKILLPTQERRIFHPYSDDFLTKIEVYSLEEIFAEKVRALFERTRSRDIYDVVSLYNFNVCDKNKIKEILPGKFTIKRISININELNEKEEKYKRAWKNSLRHQLKEIPDFEGTFRKVIKIISEIKI